GEVTGITGDSALYCVPAQQTIPLLVRWMLVLEDSDEDRLYLAKGIPRQWLLSGKKIGIERAPTRWGRISFGLEEDLKTSKISGQVELFGTKLPKEIQFKIRLPLQTRLTDTTVNGRAVELGGPRRDTVTIVTGGERKFEIRGVLGEKS